MVGAVNHSSTQQLLSVSGVSHAGRILRVISLVVKAVPIIRETHVLTLSASSVSTPNT